MKYKIDLICSFFINCVLFCTFPHISINKLDFILTLWVKTQVQSAPKIRLKYNLKCTQTLELIEYLKNNN